MKDKTLKNREIKLVVKDFIKQSAALFFIGGIAMTLLFGKFMGVHDLGSFIEVSCFQGAIWVILWMGNGILNDYLTSKISWLDHPEWRFILGVILTVFYTIGSLIILLLIWNALVFGNTLEKGLTLLNIEFFVSALLITAFVSMFVHGRAFLTEWRASASEAERLRTENLSARYETLKSQVNPHFLFNSFNVLSTLVYKNPDTAARFIKQLSNLYRYVLETKDKETVSIEEEVNALKAFSYLSTMRFGDNLDIDIALDEVLTYQIAPMTLQMLVENSIKHNVVSKAKPLSIKVFKERDEIVVQNNLQRKNNVTASAGIGLPNIQARYEYLSDQPVSIEETNETFLVRIPLLKLEA